MNQYFATEDQSETTRITKVHSITKEAFGKATDEPNKHENILSKQSRNTIDKELPSSEKEFETILDFATEQNEKTIDLTKDQDTISNLDNNFIRKREKTVFSYGGTYSCKFCKQTRFNHRDMVRHVNEVHLKIKPYSCKHCKHCSRRESDLARHVKNVHLKLKSFECQKCESAFEDRIKLKAHFSRVHLNEIQPESKNSELPCQYCDKSFSTKHYVEIHVKIVHLKHKQFSCNDCGKLFTTKALDRHIKTKHLNNKYQKCHSCSVCKIYFIQERYLKQHISEFHKNSNPSLKWMKPLLPGPLVFINDLKNKPIMHSSFELK